ncbi:hypothetical protein DNK01_15875, partial [Stutzerimonas kirkiae]
MLDLDNDGIETFGANGQVLFDHDGDGDRNGSGWVKSDDGMLVLDRSGNGRIDSGLELFGENTLLADGSKAKDGFEAMRAVDGNGDGKLDASDAVWSELRVWRDLNADGSSQDDELFTLQELGIKSIGTGSDGRTQNLGNNNHIGGFGSFEWDESRGGGVGVSADVYFEDNAFYREFGERLEIPHELQGLPDMLGSGAVRDLREAAVGSEILQNVLTDYAQAKTRQEQQALLGQLVQAWAESADFRTFDERIAELGQATGAYDIAFAYSWELAEGLGNGEGASSYTLTADQAEKKELLEMVRVLEVFNNQRFFEFSSVPRVGSSGTALAISYMAGIQGRSTNAMIQDGVFYITESGLSFGIQQKANIRAAYQALLDSVYGGLLVQTRLQPYMEKVTFSLASSGLGLDFSSVQKKFDEVASENVAKAIVDLVEFQQLSGLIQHLPSSFLNSAVVRWGDKIGSTEVDAILSQLDKGVSWLFGGTDSDTLKGSSSDDLIYGGAGDDIIIDQGGGTNTLLGGEGNDSITYSYYADNTIEGGEGDDRIQVDYTHNSSSNKNTISGGRGNDVIVAGYARDTYLFNRGDGQDSITDYGGTDRLVFGEGIVQEDLSISRKGNDLIIRVKDASDSTNTDQLTVKNWYSSAGYQIESVEFSDGHKLLAGQLTQLGHIIYGTEEADTLVGFDAGVTITAGAGDDTLASIGRGTNTLLGGEGNDSITYSYYADNTIEGGEGDDRIQVDYTHNSSSNKNTISGGRGNDVIVAGYARDTYLFNRGDGQDSIT